MTRVLQGGDETEANITKRIVDALRSTANNNNARRIASAIGIDSTGIDGKLHAEKLSRPELRHLASKTGALAGVRAVAAQVAAMAAPPESSAHDVDVYRTHAQRLIRSVKDQAAQALQLLDEKPGQGGGGADADGHDTSGGGAGTDASERGKTAHAHESGKPQPPDAGLSQESSTGGRTGGGTERRAGSRVNVGALVGAIIAAVLAVALIIGLAVALPAYKKRRLSSAKARPGAQVSPPGKSSFVAAPGRRGGRSAAAAAAAGRK